MTRPLLLESFDGVQTSSSESEAGLVEEKWLDCAVNFSPNQLEVRNVNDEFS